MADEKANGRVDWTVADQMVKKVTHHQENMVQLVKPTVEALLYPDYVERHGSPTKNGKDSLHD
eukprot:7142462-Lingulodinium_polyedra.AAC.1